MSQFILIWLSIPAKIIWRKTAELAMMTLQVTQADSSIEEESVIEMKFWAEA